MKIDLKKLKELEKKYKDSPICLNLLQQCVDKSVDFLENNVLVGGANLSNMIAVNTLLDLGVMIDEDKNTKPQQLNS
jgi:ribulose 1,5-bisphosphate synthetase/thiazole synthase